VTEILFYHLQRQPLEAVLPILLERSLERGWRCVVEAGSQERVEALDAHLWTYSEEGFLPHGIARDAEAAEHPIVLTTGPANPNGATVRFFVDGAMPGEIEGLTRAVLIFDGNDDGAVAAARDVWKALKGRGLEPSYWQQDEGGRWNKKA
jgi:DNA polymerase III subunit chi